MKASYRGALALVLGAAAAPVLAQVPPAQLSKPAAPPTPQVPGVSPAGIAVLTKFQKMQDPVMQQLAGQLRNVGTQVTNEVAGANVNVDKIAALMKQNEGLQAQLRTRADDHLLQIVKALPVSDRAPFLRAVLTSRPAQPH